MSQEELSEQAGLGLRVYQSIRKPKCEILTIHSLEKSDCRLKFNTRGLFQFQ